MLFLVLVSVQGVAAASPAWRGQGKIVELLLNYHNMGVNIKFDNVVSANGCEKTTEVIVNRSLEGYSDIYATLLAAFAAGKKVDVWLNGTCQNYRNVGTAFSVQ